VVCNVTGTWRGSGVDVAHTAWQFVLVLTQTGTAVEGAFDWHGGNGDNGRERVAGSIECGARRLTLRGVGLENAPALALASYQLGLNTAFSAMSGRWSGGVPGTLRATRIPAASASPKGLESERVGLRVEPTDDRVDGVCALGVP
jgi:hypothetical protein